MKCEICGIITGDYSTCDNCEEIYCVKHLGEQNECPLCNKEHTALDNF